VSKPRKEHAHCFYCRALVAKNDVEMDHMPVPQEAGGVDVVTACRTCHGMKDRFPLDVWPLEFVDDAMRDFEGMSRGGRILLAKMIALYAVAIKDTKAKP